MFLSTAVLCVCVCVFEGWRLLRKINGYGSLIWIWVKALKAWQTEWFVFGWLNQIPKHRHLRAEMLSCTALASLQELPTLITFSAISIIFVQLLFLSGNKLPWPWLLTAAARWSSNKEFHFLLPNIKPSPPRDQRKQPPHHGHTTPLDNV